MAAGPAIEMWSKTTGSTESTDGRTYIVKRSRAYTCTLDPSDPIDTANTAAGLPLVDSLYPGTLFVQCVSLSVSRLAPALAMIVADYEGEIGSNGEASSPVDNVVNVKWRFSITDEEIDQDINGHPIVTNNGEPIYGVTERIPDFVGTVQKNFLTVNIPAMSSYLRSRNSDTFLGFPPGTVRLMDWEAEQVITNGVPGFWKVNAVVQAREPYNTTPDKAWYKRVRHEGFMVRAVAGGEARPAEDLVTKTRSTVPVLLKEDGTRETDPESAFWLEFETTKALPYSVLGLV